MNLTESFEAFKARMEQEDCKRMAQAYWNDDASGDLSALGEFVLNNPIAFTAVMQEWAKVPANQALVRQWAEVTHD